MSPKSEKSNFSFSKEDRFSMMGSIISKMIGPVSLLLDMCKLTAKNLMANLVRVCWRERCEGHKYHQSDRQEVLIGF